MQSRARISLGVAMIAAAVLSVGSAWAQAPSEDINAAPNPYKAIDNWAKLPDGRVWGMAIGVDIDRDGSSVWIFDRCGAKSCTGSNEQV